MAWTKWCHEFSWHKCDCTEGTCSKLKEFNKTQGMAKAKKIAKPAKDQKYIVLCEGELWLTGTKQDIIDDFNDDMHAYMKSYDLIEIYELGEPIKFNLVTPSINF